MKAIDAIKIGGLFVAGFVAFKVYRKVSQGAASVVDAVTETVATDLNPVSPDNLAYKGVNAVGAAVTGDKSFSLGAWLYDLTHEDPLVAEKKRQDAELKKKLEAAAIASRIDQEPDTGGTPPVAKPPQSPYDQFIENLKASGQIWVH